jgi:hypothetical protein
MPKHEVLYDIQMKAKDGMPRCRPEEWTTVMNGSGLTKPQADSGYSRIMLSTYLTLDFRIIVSKEQSSDDTSK